LKARQYFVNATFYDFFGRILKRDSVLIESEIPGNSVRRLNASALWPENVLNNTVLLLRLRLANNQAVVDQSDYWISNPELPQNFTTLGVLRSSPIRLTINPILDTISQSKLSSERNVSISIANMNTVVAFFVQLSVVNSTAITGETRVLPVWYSANFFTLIPGERTNIVLNFNSTAPLLYVKISGWNIFEAFVPITPQYPNNKIQHNEEK